MAATLSVSQLGGPATTDPARLGCGPSSKQIGACLREPDESSALVPHQPSAGSRQLEAGRRCISAEMRPACTGLAYWRSQAVRGRPLPDRSWSVRGEFHYISLLSLLMRVGKAASFCRFEASRSDAVDVQKLLRADQPAQPIRLTAPGVPIVVEFFADQLANPEQPFDLLLHRGRFSPFQLRCISVSLTRWRHVRRPFQRKIRGEARRGRSGSRLCRSWSLATDEN